MKRLLLSTAAVMLLTGFPALTGIGPSGSYVAAGGKTAGLVAATVPESDTIILFGTALAGLSLLLRKRHKGRDQANRVDSK